MLSKKDLENQIKYLITPANIKDAEKVEVEGMKVLS